MNIVHSKRRRILAGIQESFSVYRTYWFELLLVGIISFLIGGYFVIVFFFLTGGK